jgi:hypothetical protein
MCSLPICASNGAKIEEGFRVFFSKIEANYHSSSSCLLCVAPLFFMLKEHA